MKTAQKSFAFAFIAVLLLFTFVPSSYAIDTNLPPSPTQEQIEAEKARLKALKQKMLEEKNNIAISNEKCAAVQEKVQSKLNGYSKTEGKYTDRYSNIVSKLEEVNTSLKESGYDTSELEANIETLKGLVTVFQEDYEDFKTELQSVDEAACEQGEAAFLEKMEEVRAKMKKVRDDASEIRVFIKGTLRQSLMDLKEQVKQDQQDNKEKDNE
ncbi:MAG: hypothetical protein QY318_04485 [Candidatus Dojkabacteria bacterium]|nr:MAG: hypothetical protein QY318_04485 [Candidatus Dojkabacteria bacterium]